MDKFLFVNKTANQISTRERYPQRSNEKTSLACQSQQAQDDR